MKKKKDMENLTHTLRSQGKRRIPSDVTIVFLHQKVRFQIKL